MPMAWRLENVMHSDNEVSVWGVYRTDAIGLLIDWALGCHFTNHIFKQIFLKKGLFWLKFHWNLFLRVRLINIYVAIHVGDSS